MKKLMLTVACILFAASSASAMPLQLNPDAVLGTSYGMTSVFNQLGIYAQTTSTDMNGTFSDVGDIAVQSLISSGPVDMAGLNSATNGWYLVGGWTDLTGINPAQGTYVYQAGTLDLYVSQTAYSFGSSVAAGDDTGFTSAYKVASLNLVEGIGYLAPDTSGGYTGSLDLTWKFTYMANGFWLDKDGNVISLADLSAGEKILAIADANTDLVEIPDEAHIYSDHNGSVTVGVVPEPATMALFGTGLLGLAGAGLRKKRA